MSTYIQLYRKPSKKEELIDCEYINVMKGAYFQPPEQSESSCGGYRNQYTRQPSRVCGGCRWFDGNKGDD